MKTKRNLTQIWLLFALVMVLAMLPDLIHAQQIVQAGSTPGENTSGEGCGRPAFCGRIVSHAFS